MNVHEDWPAGVARGLDVHSPPPRPRGGREPRHENRNERFHREIMRQGHNRKAGMAARVKHWRSRRRRRNWNRVARTWVQLDLYRWATAS
jgi:hypothetical protein